MAVRRSPREALLSAVADYPLENGLADLSLRPLASATGTSARMLIYHFGSKERLIVDAMDEIRDRQRGLARKWIRGHPAATLEDLLHFAWSWIAAPEHEAYGRLFLQVVGRGMRGGKHLAEFARATFQDWVSWIQLRFEKTGWKPESASALAILTVSTMRGLALYYLATKDRPGAKLSLNAFGRLLPERRGG